MFQSLRSAFPDTTPARLAESSARIEKELTMKQRRLVDARLSRQASQTSATLRESEAAHANIPDAAPNPEAQALLGERARALKRALGRLPQRERLLIRLRFEQELTLEQVAKLLALGDDCVVESGGCLATPLTTDQRGPGFFRKVGTHVDVGAFEYCPTCTAQLGSVAPVTVAIRSVGPNVAGWNNTDVTVTLNSTDYACGSGVKEVTYSAKAAQTIPATTVTGNVASIPLNAEGQTTLTYFATDNAGNTEKPQTITVNIDKSMPSISCAPADGNWHASDVSISCTASDALSGLNVSADSSFFLSTNVPAGTETANATTNSHTVCNIAGNCATAGPFSGNRIDKKAPTITLSAPVAGIYLLNQAVTASYTCTDGGSGLAACSGPVASGSPIDTVTAGTKTFTVKASDNVGNSAPPQSVSYTVSYGIQVLFDQSRAAKSGSTIPIKIGMMDANGTNMSSLAVVLHAVSVVQISTSASVTLDDAGNANPDFDFRYDSSLAATGGYIFNLKTTGYGTGSYLLNYTVGGDPNLHSVQFQVRQ
jgi:hypothetical protein